MKRVHGQRWVLSLVVLALAACSSIPVATDYDPEQDFTDLKRYAWLMPEKPSVIDPEVDNDLMTMRLIRAVNQSLTARGLQRVDTADEADVLVSFHVSTKEQLSVTRFRSAYGYYPYYGPYYGYGHYGHFYGSAYGYPGDIDVRQYTEGAFVIDLVNPDSRKLMWRGLSERRLLNSGTPDERQAFVSETIDAIFERFPPPSKASL